MAAETVLVSRTLFDDLSEHELTMSQMLVYLALRVNPSINAHGLYEISVGRLGRLTGLHDLSLVRDDLQRLSGAGLITFDNGLVMVPALSYEGRFHTWSQRFKVLLTAAKRYRTFRSAVGGRNHAYEAWLRHHEELIADLEPEEAAMFGPDAPGPTPPHPDAPRPTPAHPDAPLSTLTHPEEDYPDPAAGYHHPEAGLNRDRDRDTEEKTSFFGRGVRGETDVAPQGGAVRNGHTSSTTHTARHGP
jgi:hypothetical protein